MAFWDRFFKPREAVVETAETVPVAFANEARANFSFQNSYDYDRVSSKSLEEYVKNSHSIVAALVSIWTQAISSRQQYMQQSEELRRFYIVDAMLQLITDDVLNADENGDIVYFRSSNEEIQEELDAFQEKFDFNTLLRDITRDVIDYGEYTLRLNVSSEDKGVLDICDDVDQRNILAFYEQGLPVKFLKMMEDEYQMLPGLSHAHFVIGNDKLRIKTDHQIATQATQTGLGSVVTGSAFSASRLSDNDQRILDALPDYVRLGKPIFYGVASKLRELQMLEQLVPATKLNQLTQAQFVAVRVAASQTPDEVMKTLRKYEDLLNSAVSIDHTRDQVTMSDIMSVAGKIRALPQFSDEKGSLEALNLRQNQSVDDLLTSINDIRGVIMSSIGVPPTMLYGNVAGGDVVKSQELRLFSRYTRRLAAIQRSLSMGLKQIALIHLVNRGKKIKLADVDVVFKNSLIDLSGLEKAEFEDAKQELVGKTVDFVNQLMGNELIASAIDKVGLINWIRKKFETITDGEAIFLPPEIVDMNQQQAMMGMDQQDLGGDLVGGDGGDLAGMSGGPLEEPDLTGPPMDAAAPPTSGPAGGPVEQPFNASARDTVNIQLPS